MVSLYISIITVLSTILLSIIYPLRRYCQKYKMNNNSYLFQFNRLLRKYHKHINVFLFALIILHIILSFESFTVDIITGSICLGFMLMLLYTYVERKRLKKRWIEFHRIYTAWLWIMIVIHIIIQAKY